MGIDDGEDAVFGDKREKARGDEMDAGEGEGIQVCGGAEDFGREVAGFAAAGELKIVVEEKLAGGVALLDGERCESLTVFVKLEHAEKVDGADDVDVVKKERFVEPGLVFKEKPRSLL